MGEISFEYWNELSSQFLLIDSLLAGFSIAIVATLLVHNSDNRFLKVIFYLSTLSVLAFIVSIFANTTIKMMTTQGYPLEMKESKFFFSRIVSALSFVIGIVSIISIISVSGWVKSKKLGWFTTILGIISLVLITLV